MEVNTLYAFKNLKGETMQTASIEVNKEGKEITVKKPMIFREIITNLLNTENQSSLLTPEKKAKAWVIMKRLWDGETAELSVDERALIIERARIFYPTMTYGIIKDFLEAEQPKTAIDNKKE